MDKKELVLFDKHIRVKDDWYVCGPDVMSAINDYRKTCGLGRYNFNQWCRSLYVSTMIDNLPNDHGDWAFKIDFDETTGKSLKYFHPCIFVNMVLSSCPSCDILENEWFCDYLADNYEFDGHSYEHANILAAGAMWFYTTKNARFCVEMSRMDEMMDGVGQKNAVYSLFYDLCKVFYYNWEIALMTAKKMLGEG